mmetsp:Transcript_51709/g.155189  ORF Transcript_51709/g.155189 Transcript_51709/m.155189 type:complete len:410 (-) Transcript_51709:98-1327(-)|eukprot:CAMPEP_0113548118 /NCGR_PEP_ID=MMETSP0015_2-20120614/12722_1 /TAXON_ID=2838 /ORGANISM="Odontella" /LENGTH=409 /DNA_ID=CAMNT_0000448725 /DNA_START=261 /DNA_END=1490 /DNA_ORIENTATION=+ /assembly_acc=CAM_ASM_000160
MGGPLDWARAKFRPQPQSPDHGGLSDRLSDPLGFMGYDGPQDASRAGNGRSEKKSRRGRSRRSRGGGTWGKRPDESSDDGSSPQVAAAPGSGPTVQGQAIVQGKYPDWSDPECEGHTREASKGHDADYDDDPAEEDVYIVRQKYGYCSIFFSAVQTIVLVVMMWQCRVAPLQINPMVGPYPDALNYWGAKNAVLIIEDGERWRLVTPIFLHAGVIHLLCNASVQLETGAFFEREWGSGVWLTVYLLSAIGSSILSSCFMPNSISVGSSGAVMGLFGAKLSEVFCRACESQRTRQERIGHEVRMEQLNGVLCSVTLVGLFSFIPYVDWAAHLGGLVAGMTVGLVTFSFSIKSKMYVGIWFIIGVGSTVTAFILALKYMYNEVEPADELRDVCGYYKQYFEDYECNCQLGN